MMYRRKITLPDEQDLWLKQHPEVNFSGLVQVWLARYIQAYDELDEKSINTSGH
jgi:hypothetical protein